MHLHTHTHTHTHRQIVRSSKIEIYVIHKIATMYIATSIQKRVTYPSRSNQGKNLTSQNHWENKAGTQQHLHRHHRQAHKHSNAQRKQRRFENTMLRDVCVCVGWGGGGRGEEEVTRTQPPSPYPFPPLFSGGYLIGKHVCLDAKSQ